VRTLFTPVTRPVSNAPVLHLTYTGWKYSLLPWKTVQRKLGKITERLAESFNIILGRETNRKQLKHLTPLTVLSPGNFRHNQLPKPSLPTHSSTGSGCNRSCQNPAGSQQAQNPAHAGCGIAVFLFCPGRSCHGTNGWRAHAHAHGIGEPAHFWQKKQGHTTAEPAAGRCRTISGNDNINTLQTQWSTTKEQKSTTCSATTNFIYISMISPKKPGNWSSMPMHRAMKALMNCCVFRINSWSWNGEY
jgi:hypothetical protein